jgi:hypothetical protein
MWTSSTQSVRASSVPSCPYKSKDANHGACVHCRIHLRRRAPNPQASDPDLQDQPIAARERYSSVAWPD